MYKKILGLVLVVCIFNLIGHAAENNVKQATEKVFDVRQFGAKGDGKTLDTEAIQKALDECSKTGGGIVRLTAGTYLSKPIFLRSNTNFQLDEGATLKATDDPNDFSPNPETPKDFGFITGSGLKNIAITGKGTIDGSGARWWEPVRVAKKAKQPEPRRRPRLILLHRCIGVQIRDVTLTNSPTFHLIPKDCEDVVIEGIKIIAPNDAPNTDALDPAECRNVRISKCIFDSGDDNIAIKSGQENPAHPNAAVEYMTVTDCTFLNGHGMSIGSETLGGVRNLTVKNCTFENTESGIRIKSARGRGGIVENATYSDITMKNVGVPIHITAYYPKVPKDGNDTPQPITPTSLTPIYRKIYITNLTADSPKNAGFIIGVPESPLSEIVLENVNITAPKGLTVRNAKVTLKNVKIETKEGPPFILESGAVVEGLQSPAKPDANSLPKKVQDANDANNAAKKIRIVLVGDSTVTDKAGWGLGFKQFLTNKAECINTSAGGRSSKSFIDENRWTQALELKGDYYLIQFGHNDEPGKGPERQTEPNTTYREYMTRYVDEARAIGAKPILVTSLVRRQWDKSGSGKISSSLIPYVETVKQIAKEKNVPLIDLHAQSRELCEKLGKEKCLEFSPVKDNNQPDNTHLNTKGSPMFARLVVEELVRAVPELKPCFRSEPVADTNAAAAEQVLDVRQFGAKGDGNTIDTEAIQKALDQCGRAGGGIVHLTAGTYLSKPIFLRSNTTLRLDQGAILKATDDPNDFVNTENKSSKEPLAFVNGNTLTNITIEGKGTIDGSGAKWWEPVRQAKKNKQPEPRRRPRMVVLNKCVCVRIKDVTLTNSPSFHLVPRDCEDVDIVRVTIIAPDDAPNTDAIDPSTSRYVQISDCVIDAGDDNIVIKSGHPDPAHPNAAAEYITVFNCKFLHGHGMSIGSDTIGGVRNMNVKNCTFENTESGIRIKSYREKGGVVEKITYDNLTMKNVKIPINITAYYPKIPKDGNDTAQPVTNSTPKYSTIKISNLTATSPKSAGIIVGLPEWPITDVVLENVHITAPKGLTVRNAKLILKNVKIETQEGPPFILESGAVVEGLEKTTK